MINTIIVENDRHHSEDLSKLLSDNFKDVKVLAICKSKKDGIEQIKKHEPDLVFMDIELDDDKHGGFNILKETHSLNYEVIFTTSYSEYALKAFKFSAIDFLLKSIKLEELTDAIERFRKRVKADSRKKIETLLHNEYETEGLNKILVIPVVKGLDFILVSDIIMCVADNIYTEIFLVGSKSKVLATKTLKAIEEQLGNSNFRRVHKKFLVNINHVKKYRRESEYSDGGEIELTDGHKAYVSRRGKDDFLNGL